MTSKPIKVHMTLRLTPVGEAPEEICTEGTLLTKEGKSLLQYEDKRIQIQSDRVLIRQGYLLELCPGKETSLSYPTPYGELSMKVQTKHLKVREDHRQVEALYALYTNGQLIHKINMKLKLEEIK